MEGTFFKSPAPTSQLPSFFEDLDVRNAFKKHGVCIMKVLTLETTHTNVLNTFILMMMAREEEGVDDIEIPKTRAYTDTACGAVSSREVTTFKASTVALAKVSMTSMVQWMHATALRYKDRSKH
jgi:hypothetical protein